MSQIETIVQHLPGCSSDDITDYCIFYHADMDGAAAAAIARKMLCVHAEHSENPYIVRIRTYPVQYGTPFDFSTITAKDNVFIVDFSYDRQTCIQIHEKAKSLVILDHHKTAEEELKGLPFAIFNNRMSGAMLSFFYFTEMLRRANIDRHSWIDGDTEAVNNIQKAIILIDQRDMWERENPEVDELHEWLLVFKGDKPEFIRRLHEWLFVTIPQDPGALDQAIAKGAAYREKTKANVAKVTRHPIEFQLLDQMAVAVFSSIDQSDIGEALYTSAAYASHVATIIQVKDDKFIFSLRSAAVMDGDEDVGIDVSEIAKFFGGGGHKHAAGFSLPYARATELLFSEDRLYRDSQMQQWLNYLVAR